MEKITAMRTAKDLAWKAYNDGLKIVNPDYCNEFNASQRRERFENWWDEHYVRAEHKDGFNAEHFVMIDRKVYIQAE